MLTHHNQILLFNRNLYSQFTVKRQVLQLLLWECGSCCPDHILPSLHRSNLTRTEGSDWQCETGCLVNAGPTLHNHCLSHSFCNIRSVIAVRNKKQPPSRKYWHVDKEKTCCLLDLLDSLQIVNSEFLSVYEIIYWVPLSKATYSYHATFFTSSHYWQTVYIILQWQKY